MTRPDDQEARDAIVRAYLSHIGTKGGKRPKNYSEQERERRRQAIARARTFRKGGKTNGGQSK